MSSTPTGSVWDTNMTAVTSCENTLLIVFTDVLSGYVKFLEQKKFYTLEKTYSGDYIGVNT